MASPAPKFSSRSPTVRRILREASEVSGSPSPDYAAEPLESDLFEWHFTLKGPPSSVYSEGIYHGRIVLPPTYPLRPPSFRFTTPNGRFEVNREICLSISGHHEETWQPAWGIRTAIVALRSFMETDAQGQLGGLDTSDAVRQRLAKESAQFKCPQCAQSNAQIIEASAEASAKLSAPAEEVTIPKEMSMGWRDEMKPASSDNDTRENDQTKGETRKPEPISEENELAEGFIATGPLNHAATLPSPATAVSSNQQPSVGQTPSTQTETRPAGLSHEAATLQMQARDPAVPLWLDRAIVGLVVLLAALLAKIIFGL